MPVLEAGQDQVQMADRARSRGRATPARVWTRGLEVLRNPASFFDLSPWNPGGVPRLKTESRFTISTHFYDRGVGRFAKSFLGAGRPRGCKTGL
jgi:hypothetical protein